MALLLVRIVGEIVMRARPVGRAQLVLVILLLAERLGRVHGLLSWLGCGIVAGIKTARIAATAGPLVWLRLLLNSKARRRLLTLSVIRA